MEAQTVTSSDAIIKLNVGGYKYTTTKSTLLKAGNNSFFSLLLSGKFGAAIEDGYYFIDRDGQYFGVLLEYLRTGDLNIPSNISQKAVTREANFFSIEVPLMDSVYDSSAPSPKTNGVYVNPKDETNFYIFGVDFKGFNNKEGAEFKWKMKYPLLELVFLNVKTQIQYKEGITYKESKRVLLFDDGNIFDTDGAKLAFYPASEVIPGKVYECPKSVYISAKETVSHVVFNTYRPRMDTRKSSQNETAEPTEEEGEISLLWASDGVKNWAAFTYKPSTLIQLDALTVSFMWTSSKLEIIPLKNVIYARKIAGNEIYKFERFVVCM